MTLIEFLKAGNQIKANWNVISSYTRTVSVDDLDDEEHPLTKLDDIVNNAIVKIQIHTIYMMKMEKH